jgi:hypothetical protein
MNGESLKRWQLERIQKALQPNLNYLHRLRKRMDDTGFVPDDRLYRHVSEAYDKTYALLVELHYLIVGHGMGRPVRKE